jgi:hypothetical protein
MVLSPLTVRASCNHPLQRRLQRFCLAALIVSLLVGLAACGGSGSSTASTAAPQTLLSQTFGAGLGKIRSGILSLTIDADLKGLRAVGGKPLSLQLSGPFIESPGAATEFDFAATVSVRGATLPVGLIAAGKSFYVEFGGSDYSVGSSVLSSMEPRSTSSASSADLLACFGIDPLDWLASPQSVGNATVGGVSTTEIKAQIDVGALVTDFAKLAGQLPAGEGRQITKALSASNESAIASAVNSADADIYTGTHDHILREARIALTFTIPAAGQSLLDGVTGGSFTLAATITDLNAPETITAPKHSQPISDLLGHGGLLGL